MGRTAIFMVMGMTAIFLFFGKSANEVGTEAVDNSITYYENTQRYNIAVAGANLACNAIFLDKTWRAGFSNMSFNGGIINVTLYDSASGKVVITSTGTYQSSVHTVKILLNPSSISKFAMYSGNVSAAAKLRSGDTINGPIHFNSKLVTQGNPVFIGKATMGSLQTTSGTPTFLGGYQTGVNIPFPSYTASANAIVAAASAVGGTNDYHVGGEMYLRFSVVAGVTKVEYKSSSAAVWEAPVDLATFAPTGNIAMVNGTVHVEGTLKGQVTITSTVFPSTTVPSATVGATYIESNLRYNTDPLITPSSTDMLGLVSAGDIIIEEIPIRIDGSFFTNTSMKLDASLINTNPAEQLKIVGSLITKDIGPTDFGTGASKGANFYMKYDTRLENNPPANFPFPSTNSFEVLSWFE